MARFQLEPKAPETGIGSVGRNIARTVARAGESALGTPGDILSGVLGLGELGAQKLGATKPTIFNEIRQFIPTSETVKKYGTESIAKFLPQGYLEPQGEYEKLADELVGDFVSFVTPTVGPLKIGTKAAAAITGAGNAAKQLAKSVDLGEGAQEGVKLGAMLATSLAGLPKLNAYKDSLYTAARENLPEGARTSAEKLIPSIRKAEKIATKGHVGAAEKEALDFLKSVEDKIAHGSKTVSLDSVWQLKKDLNDWAFKSSKVAETKAAQQLLRPVKEGLTETLNDARKEYPKFVDNLFAADEIHKAVNSSGKIGQFLREHISFDALKSPLTSALAGASYASGFPIIKGGIGLGIGKGLYLAGEAALKSPQVRKYYIDVIQAAARKNATQLLKSTRLLDQALLKEQNQSKSEGPFSRFVLSSD